MSDLDGPGVPAAGNLSVIASGKLRSLGSDPLRATSEELVDAFAEVFAKMAAGSVSRIHSDSSRNRSLRSEPTATLAASRTASDAGGER
ncbi:MAG: hypothetical protein ACR2NZ_11940, partial [Rubripirellula sp.]